MAGRRTRRNTTASAQSTVRSDHPEQGMIVPVNGLETALNNVANMMANIMERLDQALPGPSGTRNVPAGQPRQVLRTASSPILQELHDPEEVEKERQAIARRQAEEMARNNKANGDRTRAVSQVMGNGNENSRGTIFERISHQRAHVSERLGKNPDKAPQGWVRPQVSQVASSNREPRQRAGRGGSQAPMRSLVILDEEEVQSQARVPAPQRLGPQVPEAGEFQDLRQQIQEMQRKINKARVFTTRTNTPLAPRIFAEPYSQGFKMPFVKRYDGKLDPQEHINSYVQVNHIPAGSIRTWDELGLRFLEHFAGNCRPKNHFTHLASVRQKHGESLKNFLVRWRKESREVEGIDDKSRLAMFTAALQDGLLHTDLTTHPPDTFEEAMVRARRYVTLEERKEEKKEKAPKEEEKAGNKKPFKNKKQGFPDGPKGTNYGTSEKHKFANLVFTLPVAEVMDHAAQQGLMTYPTYSQKVCNVEDTGKWLIRRGHLKKFVQDGDGGNPANAQNGKRRDGQVAQAEAREKRHIGHEDEEEDSEPAPHRQKRHHGCNYIIGGNIGGDSTTSRKKWANAAIVNKVVAREGKKLKNESIIFSNADLPEIGVPHRDALVITIDIMDLLIHKTLVDTGSSVNIMYMDTYKALGLTRDELLPIMTPLTGFTGDSIEPDGVITLPVEIGDTKATKKLDMEFVVVGIISNTNIILGRPDTQVGEVTAQLLRAEERRPRVEVAGDIEEVELELGIPRRLVRIGKDLGAELRSRVIFVLRRFRKVFAWSPADMPGLDHKIAVHRLNVLRDAKPVKQKRRHLSFQFRVSNNEAEYKALINGLKILGKLGVSRVQVYSDSRLVVGQISGEFEEKEERMKRYRDLSLVMLGRFEYKLEHIPRANNAEANVLSKLGAESPEYISTLATVEELATPSLNRDEVLWASADPLEWLDRLARYIEDGVAPEDPQEARLLRMRAPTYKVQDGVLYKRSYNGILLRCLRAAEARALMEEIHEGICAAHQGPYSISRRAVIQGYFWPTMRKDYEEYVCKCPTCQQFQNVP
ncbi:unnamed protein product [Cuscuta campestris]|uniref:Uncharacterized protein n=1 Tax=Cuscuta campestris TaxID=132261 RepID=A0A484NSN8_9ASTE|nr:unnamed protein product [Cuscuta campestris]